MFRKIWSSVYRYTSITPGINARQEPTGAKRMWHFGVFPRPDESAITSVECVYENYFNRPEIDGWELRKGLCELHGMDLVPSPPVTIAALRACRRINDYALAVRMLEAVKFKCGPHLGKIWPYYLQEIGPTLKELGIDTPEQLGYDKPELWLQDVEA